MTTPCYPYRTKTLGAAVRLLDLQRDCVRVVLGEPTEHLFTDVSGTDLRRKLSIRGKLCVDLREQGS